MPDPTPEAGGGAKVLVDAGVEVAYAPDPTPFVALNEGWLRRSATGIPLVTAKIALSLDAHPAFVMGQRASISGPAGREITNRLRQRADAVLVGAATVIADDPSLTVRDAAGVFADHQPVRVVLVRSSVPDWTARVFADGAAQTLLLVPESMSASVLGAVPSAVVVHYYSEGGGLLGALRTLGSLGINEVLVEPGPHLMTSLWHDGLIDVLVTVTAGGMAGPDAPPMYRGPTDREDHALRRTFEPREAGIVGDVVVTEWRRSDDEHH
jgi:diaminohydroxyphosphoribosylaminopyrimidine deaminase/5-amino-6-(5-phosphoribosylamino)uracil reductase